MTEKEFEKAKEELSRARGIKAEIEEMQERIKKLYSNLTNGTKIVTEKVSAPNGNTEEEKRIKHSELQNTLISLENELKSVLNEITVNIYKIQNSRLRRILMAYYVDCKTWEQTAEEMHCNSCTVYRLRQKAIKAYAECRK